MAQGIDPAKLRALAVRQLKPRLEAACVFLQGEIRQLISIPSRTVKYERTKGGAYRKVLGPRGSNRSRPGEPPHKDFGTLRQSITWVVEEQADKLVGRVGSALPYSRYLEFGTSRMAARPFLRRTLKESGERVRQILEHGGTYDIKS